jgi:hypothetical protein
MLARAKNSERTLELPPPQRLSLSHRSPSQCLILTSTIPPLSPS